MSSLLRECREELLVAREIIKQGGEYNLYVETLGELISHIDAALASGDEVTHIEGKWCADLHCQKCYVSETWQKSEVEQLKARLKEAEACIRDAKHYVPTTTGSYSAVWHKQHAVAIERAGEKHD